MLFLHWRRFDARTRADGLGFGVFARPALDWLQLKHSLLAFGCACVKISTDSHSRLTFRLFQTAIALFVALTPLRFIRTAHKHDPKAGFARKTGKKFSYEDDATEFVLAGFLVCEDRTSVSLSNNEQNGTKQRVRDHCHDALTRSFFSLDMLENLDCM